MPWPEENHIHFPPFESISATSLRRALSALRHTRAAERLDDNPLLQMALLEVRLRNEGMSDSAESRRWVLSSLLHEIVQDRLLDLRSGDTQPDLAQAPANGDVILAEDFASANREREAWSALHARYLSERELAMSEVTEIAGVGRTTLARRLNAGLEALAEGLRVREQDARLALGRAPKEDPQAPLLESAGAATSSTTAHATDKARKLEMPQRRTRFLGREAELESVSRHLDEARLVTVTGAGGSGKTRLALEIAQRRRHLHPEGTYWVDLEARSGAEATLMALAETLDIQSAARDSLLTTLAATVGPSQRLIVLDNCEHLIDEVATIVDALLCAGDGIRILATSQEAIGIDGERVFPLPPLGLPEALDQGTAKLESLASSDAISLFVDRARSGQAHFELSEENATAVIEICRRLDGLPLAIELAASRVKLMAPAQIATRLDQRFQLLKSGQQREATPRHHTLRASLDWSYALLDDGEKLLLQRCSVAAGSWAVEDVEAICAGLGVDAWLALDTLGRLVDKSFVVVETAGEETRYRLLESVRQYAREQLKASGDEPRMQEAHAQHFLAVAEAAEPELKGPNQAEVLQRLQTTHENLVVAIERSAQNAAGAETALRLVCALGQFWSKRNAYMERGRTLVVRLLESTHTQAPGLRPLRAKAMIVAGNLTRAQGSPAVSLEFYEEGYHLALEDEDDRAVARALTGLGKATASMSRYAEAKQHMRQSLLLYRELGDKLGIASSLNTLGVIAEQQGDTEAALSMHEQAAGLAGELGDELSQAISLGNLARALLARGDTDMARQRFHESAAISERIGDRIGVAWVAQQLGGMALEAGRCNEAEEQVLAGLKIFRELGNEQRIAWCLQQLAEIELAHGKLDKAEALAQESLAISESIEVLRAVAGANGILGLVYRASARQDEAREHARESLRIYRQLEERPGIATALARLMDLAKDEGDLETAERLETELQAIEES